MRDLPQSYNVRFGTMKIRRGKLKDKSIISWDAIPDCRGEDCNSFRYCFAVDEAKNHGDTKRCLVMSSYLRSVSSIILSNYPTITESDLLRVGLHLIPMYRNLCRLQIEEHGLRHIFRQNKGGNMVAHPVYDLIRNYILSIDTLWNRLNLDKKYLGRKKPKGEKVSLPDVDDIMLGDPDYYEGLDDTESAEEEATNT
ncbi:hypothetical protein LCGC14_1992160 [marine sediment metagenome]|uniref:Uncharacterized protein n=1 Tax=marine sediment metagenome TaxID=412755 RepID=A0A0F9F5X7_9ZZZZ